MSSWNVARVKMFAFYVVLGNLAIPIMLMKPVPPLEL